MRKANGFIFMETIVVVSVLSVTLLSLFSSFSFILKKSRERETYDTTAYIYKTFLVSKEISQQFASQSSDNDSFINALKLYIKESAKNKNNCWCYKLVDNPEGSNEPPAEKVRCNTSNNNYDNHLVTCRLTNEDAPDNPTIEQLYNTNNRLKLIAKVFNIQNVYLVTPSKLMDSSYKDYIYHELDATAIDYLNAKALTTDKLFIVKYKTNYVGLSNDQNKEYSIFFSSMVVD